MALLLCKRQQNLLTVVTVVFNQDIRYYFYVFSKSKKS